MKKNSIHTLSSVEQEQLDYEDETSLENISPQLTLIKNVPDKMTNGRDEMNFSEFPLSVIARRPDKNVKTITFRDEITDKSINKKITRELIITGTDKFGLPHSIDEYVLIGLIQLTRLQNFQYRKVYYNRFQLLKLLGWKANGQNYKRLKLALDKWVGVSLYYNNSWRDKLHGTWGNRNFHIIELTGEEKVNGETLDFFVWNSQVFKSFENGNLKSLNYDFLKTLKSAISQKLYRFLDKRFYNRNVLEFNLKTLCYEKIGLSRNFPTASLKRELNDAIDELENKGYLEAIPRENRYIKRAAGIWDVVFKLKSENAPVEIDFTNKELSLKDKLLSFGLKQKKIDFLFDNFPEKLIEEKFEIACWLKGNNDPKVSNNAPGFLVASIENDYSSPKEYLEAKKEIESKIIQQKIIQVKKIETEQKQLLESKKEEDKKSKVESFLSTISEEERNALTEEALKRANIGQRKMLAMGGRVEETTRKNLLNELVLELL